MKRTIRTIILSGAGGLVLFWYAGGSGAQPILATGPDAEVTEEGLHRVHPSIMANAWVRPDLDLSRYTRILLMPTAVLFRDVPERRYDPRSAIATAEFPLDDEKKEWLRGVWHQAIDAEFGQEESYELEPIKQEQCPSLSRVKEIPRNYSKSQRLQHTLDSKYWK